MYKIKTIEDKDFYKLLELHYCLQQELPTKHNKSISAIILCQELCVDNKMVVGLYKDEELVGFISGYEETKEVFYMANFFVEKRYRFKTKSLMDYVENKTKKLGYKAWKCDSITKKGKNILTKYGAKEI